MKFEKKIIVSLVIFSMAHVKTLKKTRKRKNGRANIYFFKTSLSVYSVEFLGDIDKIKK